MLTIPRYVAVALALATKAAARRPDCDRRPVLTPTAAAYYGPGQAVEVEDYPEPGTPAYVTVDLCYNSAGWCALYEYRIRDGRLSLAQD